MMNNTITCDRYLGHTKSSGSGTLIPYRKLKETFFLYSLIEKRMLYFSMVFDHTSTLQFLETFLNKKFNKNIRIDNISQWRRTICGNLTAAFSPFDGTKPVNIPFVNRDPDFELGVTL